MAKHTLKKLLNKCPKQFPWADWTTSLTANVQLPLIERRIVLCYGAVISINNELLPCKTARIISIVNIRGIIMPVKILVVDGSASDRLSIKNKLKEYNILSAGSSMEAVRILKEHEIHLLILCSFLILICMIWTGFFFRRFLLRTED